MTSYLIQYQLVEDQKLLLRDLLVYQICKYDSEIASGKTTPSIGRRQTAVELLSRINKDTLCGSESMATIMSDIIDICKPITDIQRKDYGRNSLYEDGIVGILCLYSDKTIYGLLNAIQSPKIYLKSSSSFCL